ncbi:MAG: TRAP transporter small permease subunit [Geminicoccaceae bacterium]
MTERDDTGLDPTLIRRADRLDQVNRTVGNLICWCAAAMVLLQFMVVVLRYVFGISFIFLDEGVLYLHGALFMLGAGYTLLVQGHVRVDIFFSRWSAGGQARLNLVGHLLFLLPAMTTLLVISLPSVRRSWAILEGPISVGGIPASFLLKSLIPAFCVLVIIQGLSCLCRDWVRFRTAVRP